MEQSTSFYAWSLSSLWGCSKISCPIWNIEMKNDGWSIATYDSSIVFQCFECVSCDCDSELIPYLKHMRSAWIKSADFWMTPMNLCNTDLYIKDDVNVFCFCVEAWSTRHATLSNVNNLHICIMRCEYLHMYLICITYEYSWCC